MLTFCESVLSACRTHNRAQDRCYPVSQNLFTRHVLRLCQSVQSQRPHHSCIACATMTLPVSKVFARETAKAPEADMTPSKEKAE